MHQECFGEPTRAVAGEGTRDRVNGFTTGKGPGSARVPEIGGRQQPRKRSALDAPIG
jgi:hypothetical protein